MHNATAPPAPAVYQCAPWCTDHAAGTPSGRTPDPEDQVCQTTIPTPAGDVRVFHSIDDGPRVMAYFDDVSPAAFVAAAVAVAAAIGRCAMTTAQGSADVHEFMVQVIHDRPMAATHDVLGNVRFHAEPRAACDMAHTMLPGLCAQLGVDADPDRVHGMVFRCVPAPDGVEDGYVGSVFLPGSTDKKGDGR